MSGSNFNSHILRSPFRPVSPLSEEAKFIDWTIFTLHRAGHVDTANVLDQHRDHSQITTFVDMCLSFSSLLVGGRSREAEALQHVINLYLEFKSHEGLSLQTAGPFTEEIRADVTFKVEAILDQFKGQCKKASSTTVEQAGRQVTHDTIAKEPSSSSTDIN
jgi:hypothetical protein